MNNNITTVMNVNENEIKVIRINNTDYISLTDLARYKNNQNPGDVIIKWMSNKSSFDFYSLWEELFNDDFKLAESREFKTESATQSFTMSPSRWISLTNAKGFISKRGKKGNIVPCLTEKQKQFIYANEADVINVALFGMTAKE